MCRFLVYKGQPVRLKKVILDPPHSLESQSYNPRELLSGNVNVDGFGCGWYKREVSQAPGVYINLSNLWADKSFKSISKLITPSLFFASVRNATPPSPVDQQSIQPFAKGPYLFMHNGRIEKYHRKLKRPLHNLIPNDLYTTLYSHSDSATIFMLLFDKLRQDSPMLENMKNALVETIGLITDFANKQEVGCQLNIALTNGEQMIAVRYSTEEESNSLYYLENGQNFPGSVIMASERLDDDEHWISVPHNSIITVDKSNTIDINLIDI